MREMLRVKEVLRVKRVLIILFTLTVYSFSQGIDYIIISDGNAGYTFAKYVSHKYNVLLLKYKYTEHGLGMYIPSLDDYWDKHAEEFNDPVWSSKSINLIKEEIEDMLNISSPTLTGQNIDQQVFFHKIFNVPITNNTLRGRDIGIGTIHTYNVTKDYANILFDDIKSVESIGGTYVKYISSNGNYNTIHAKIEVVLAVRGKTTSILKKSKIKFVGDSMKQTFIARTIGTSLGNVYTIAQKEDEFMCSSGNIFNSSIGILFCEILNYKDDRDIPNVFTQLRVYATKQSIIYSNRIYGYRIRSVFTNSNGHILGIKGIRVIDSSILRYPISTLTARSNDYILGLLMAKKVLRDL